MFISISAMKNIWVGIFVSAGKKCNVKGFTTEWD
jgi:hypothetical protein